MRFATIIAAFSLLAALSGCVHEREGPAQFHYQEFKTRAPTERTVFVCSAYGCKQQTPVKFGPEQMAEIAALMKKTKKADTPHEERRAIAYAVAWAETYAGKIAGTSADRPGMEFAGSGDPTQQDCVDEATNTTSYMLMLEKAGLLKHHKVGRPFAKEGNVLLAGVAEWPHWTAVLWEKENNTKWAVDSWIYANGVNPAVVEADKWYIQDLDNLPDSQT
jgi:hypothetical protein